MTTNYVSTLTNSGTTYTLKDAEARTALEGKASTNLSNVTPVQTFKDNVITWNCYDFANGISMGFSSTPLSTSTETFTCPSAGLVNLCVYKNSMYNTIYLYINDTKITEGVGLTATLNQNWFIPVSDGDVLKLITDKTSTTYNVYIQQFYPVKGVGASPTVVSVEEEQPL